MGIIQRFRGRVVGAEMTPMKSALDWGTVECNGTAEVTFTHELGVVPTLYSATCDSTGSFIVCFKAVPTAVGGTLYANGSATLLWTVQTAPN